MYKLVIVDDEPSTAYGLKECIDWSSYGIEVVGVANDGMTALPLIESLLPDIVITDVRMPLMDGIELAGQLRSKLIPVKIVFVSGYDDKSYLHSALRAEAVDYLLKPIQLPELRQVIAKTVESLHGEGERIRMMHEMDRKLAQSFPLLRGQFLSHLAQDGFRDAAALGDKLAFLDIRLPLHGLFCALVVEKDDVFEHTLSLPEREQQLLAFAVLNICQEIIDARTNGYAFSLESGRFVCLLSLRSPDEEDDLYALIREMKSNLERILKGTFTFGVGSSVSELQNISVSYGQAAAAVRQKLYMGKSRIVMMESLERQAPLPLLLDSARAASVTEAVKMASEERLNEFLADAFGSIREMKTYDLSMCHQFCQHLLLLGSLAIADLGIERSPLLPNDPQLQERLIHTETLDDMETLLRDVFARTCREVASKRAQKSSPVVERIKEIIGTQYAQPLSLTEVAEQVYLTSTYICLIFKQETGETFNEYLTKMRLEKAKELLLQPGSKLNQVCQAVGYPDPSYFAKLFKRYAGCTPTEFKETAR